MIEYVLFGFCIVLAGYLTHKLTSWYRRQFDRKVISYVLSNPELQEELRKLL